MDRTTGAMFCFVGVSLIGIQYITAAIHSLSPHWAPHRFESIMNSVGPLPLYLGLFFLSIGTLISIFGKRNGESR